MEHKNSFLTGFLTGQRLKRWQLSAASGDVPGGGTDFYQWAGQSGAPPELSGPDAYQQYLSSLSFTRLMDGKIIWQVTTADLTALTLPHYWVPDSTYYFSPSRSGGFSYHRDDATVNTDFYPADERSFRYYSHMVASGHLWLGVNTMRMAAPASGAYKRLATPVFSGNRLYGGTLENYTRLYQPPANIEHFHAGQEMSLSVNGDMAALFDGYMFLPAYEVQLSDPSGGADIRPGLLAGSPMNETAGTFTNPITGEIISFDSWTYDYQTRTYTLTLPGGNKMDVTFGDNTIRITEGLGGGEINVEGETVEAMYPDNAGLPIVSPDGDFQKEAFLSGLAAGMASHGF